MQSRLISALGSLLLAVAACPAAWAQGSTDDPRRVDATQFGERVALGPDWLFAAGDNPAWASPGIDDSAWKIVSTNRQLIDYGIRDIPYAWYRIHVHLRPDTRNLVVALQSISGSYEVYANGVRIGGNGKMTGLVWFTQSGLLGYSVPDSLIAQQSDLVLAIRFALNRGGNNGRGTSTPFFAHSVYLVSRDAFPRDASYLVAHSAGPAFLLCIIGMIAGLVSFSLYLSLRSQLEYLAISIYLLASSVQLAILVLLRCNVVSVYILFAMWIALGIENFALIEFVRLVLRLPRARWLLTLEVVSSLAFLTSPIYSLGIGTPTFYVTGSYLPLLAVKIVLPVLLLRGFVRGSRDAGLLLPAILVGSFADYWSFAGNLIFFLHITPLYFLSSYSSLPVGSYDVDLYRVGDFIFYIAVLLFLVLRTVAIARERARSAAELEAARTVQQVLIPEEIPAIPGFVVRSVYRPAGRVGGDFFQILPTSNGGVLVVIGDVSGKGMPAAMTVSLLVGTVRTLAHYTQSPGEILAAMNQRMLARSGGGFTTCLVLRADVDGTLTVANAGHIAPYVGGKELSLENGLPLGLSAQAAYVESTFALGPGEQVTLVTDGVVEARDKTGALFGFERTATISIEPAEAIAQAAQAFGQDDDITALTLARTA
jgi:Stage II sporulation protein E (SpoIIE)